MKPSFWQLCKWAAFGTKPLMSPRIRRFINENPDGGRILCDKINNAVNNQFEIEIDGKMETFTIV